MSLDVSGTADDVTFTYTRDDLGRITGESISNDTYAFKAHKFTVDQVNYNANENNQYMVPADVLHGYDLNGNLTDDGNYQYSYDSENRLIEARKHMGNTTVPAGSYEYDALGRRSQKTNHVQGNVTTRYQYDGAQVLAEYNDNMVMQRRYVYGPGIDNPLMVQEADGTRRYLHRDGKGSIIAATSSNNSVYAKFTADVWGFGADEATSPYRFTARRMDEETGNYYYRNRYYHTDSGRFMSNDPIGYGDGLNMYAYVSNDPVNYRDPLGLNSVSCYGEDQWGGWVELDFCGSGPSGGDGRFTTINDLEAAGFGDFYSGYAHEFDGEVETTLEETRQGFEDCASVVADLADYKGVNGKTPLRALVNSILGDNAFSAAVTAQIYFAETASQNYGGGLYRASVTDDRNFLGFGNQYKRSNPVPISDARGIDHYSTRAVGMSSGVSFYSGDLRAHAFASSSQNDVTVDRENAVIHFNNAMSDLRSRIADGTVGDLANANVFVKTGASVVVKQPGASCNVK